MDSSHAVRGDGLPVPALSSAREQAHASLAVSSDATALPAVVSTPTVEHPHPFFTNGANDDSSREGRPAASNGDDESSTNGFTSAVAANLRQIAESNSISTRSASLKRTNAVVSLQDAAAAGTLHSPVCFPAFDDATDGTLKATTSKMVLELVDGTAFQGFSFGAKGKSISGECVFQTGKPVYQMHSINTLHTPSLHTHLRMMNVMLAPVSNSSIPLGKSL
jgi:hypothetical protein